MRMLETSGKRLLQRVFAGLDRADEIGGEIRDYIQERVLVDERYVKLRKRIAALRGTTYVSKAEAEAARAARADEARAAAPPPDKRGPKATKALGNPELPAQIFGRNSCPWTGRVITLFEGMKVDYDYVDLDDADNEHYVNRLVTDTKQNTTPYVFVRGEFVGGFNALSEIHRAGQLEYLLMSAEERDKANPALKSIVITPRPNSDEVAPGES